MPTFQIVCRVLTSMAITAQSQTWTLWVFPHAQILINATSIVSAHRFRHCSPLPTRYKQQYVLSLWNRPTCSTYFLRKLGTVMVDHMTIHPTTGFLWCLWMRLWHSLKWRLALQEPRASRHCLWTCQSCDLISRWTFFYHLLMSMCTFH